VGFLGVWFLISRSVGLGWDASLGGYWFLVCGFWWTKVSYRFLLIASKDGPLESHDFTIDGMLIVTIGGILFVLNMNRM
jgi:hypothetical protein